MGLCVDIEIDGEKQKYFLKVHLSILSPHDAF